MSLPGVVENVVLCNSEVETGDAALQSMSGSIVYARGSLRWVSISDSVVISGGAVEVGRLRNSVVFAAGEIKVASPDPDNSSIVRPNERKLFEKFPMPTAADAGLGVAARDKAVVVTGVKAGSPFAAAGLQPGDEIAALNQLPVAVPLDVDRLLCRAAATAQYAAFKVRRAGKTLYLGAPYRE